MRTIKPLHLLGIVASLIFVHFAVQCLHAQDSRGTPFEAGTDSTNDPRKLNCKHLKNVVAVHANLLSGAVPEGEEAFKELRSLGIKTVISVDGMKPDADLAARYGLRYVHLPHGYEGISSSRLQEISKGLVELPKPIYIHCHHGKHRSPAAAAAACISVGWIDGIQGKRVLALAGTNPNYRGLVEAVNMAAPIENSALQSLKVTFSEASEIQPMTEAMVSIDELFDSIVNDLAKSRAAIKSSEEIADNALLLAEHYRELRRGHSKGDFDTKEFKGMLEQAENLAIELEAAIRKKDVPTMGLVEQLKSNCSQCHQKFRDNRPVSSAN